MLWNTLGSKIENSLRNMSGLIETKKIQSICKIKKTNLMNFLLTLNPVICLLDWYYYSYHIKGLIESYNSPLFCPYYSIL